MFKRISFLFLILSFSLSAFTQEKVYGDEDYVLEIQVVESESFEPVPDVEVYLFNKNNGDLLEQKSTINGGRVYFDISPKGHYEVHTCKSKYIDGGVSIDECYEKENREITCVSGAEHYAFIAAGGSDKSEAMLQARIAIDKIEVGKTFQLENIYFALDKSFLRESAQEELDEVYQILRRYPTMRIELSSHTDSRASNAYNIDLSQRRAQSTLDYLVNRGIDRDRMIAKGYGETRLVNECADGVPCTEEQHQKNRRTEFKVLSFEGIQCEVPTIESITLENE